MELHQQWGDVGLLQLVEDQHDTPFWTIWSGCRQVQTSVHLPEGHRQMGGVLGGEQPDFSESNKAKRHDRDIETTRSDKSQPIINRDSQFSSSERQGADFDVYVVGRAGRRL